MEKSKLRFLAFYFWGFVMVLTSCVGGGNSGGGGGDVAVQADPPIISNLTYSPTSANLNSGGGTVTVNGTADFVDQGGNLSTLTISVFNSAGNQVSTNSNPIPGVAGSNSGLIIGTLIVSTAAPGDFTFQVYVTDSKGSKSDTLTGSFSVKEMWVTKTPLPPPPGPLAASAGNGKIYAIGGWTGQASSNRMQQYDPATDTWITKTPMPTARTGLAAGAVNGKIYAIGGSPGGGPGVMNTVEEYDPATDTWITKAPMPTARLSFAVGVVNGKIYAIGGGDQTGMDVNTVEEYDPATDTWTTKAPMLTARSLNSAAVVNAKILIFGGSGFGTGNKVEEYDPTTDTWTTKAPMPTERWASVAGAVSGKIYVIGGQKATNEVIGTVEEYDPATNTWATKTPMPTTRAYLAAEVVNGKIYAIGGLEAGSKISSAVEEYDPAKDITQAAPIPTPVLSVTPPVQTIPHWLSGSTTFLVSNTGGGTMDWFASVPHWPSQVCQESGAGHTGGLWLWITSGSSGTNSGIITVSFAENPCNFSREEKITVTAPGATGSPTVVFVQQASKPQPWPPMP